MDDFQIASDEAILKLNEEYRKIKRTALHGASVLTYSADKPTNTENPKSTTCDNTVNCGMPKPDTNGYSSNNNLSKATDDGYTCNMSQADFNNNAILNAIPQESMTLSNNLSNNLFSLRTLTKAIELEKDIMLLYCENHSNNEAYKQGLYLTQAMLKKVDELTQFVVMPYSFNRVVNYSLNINMLHKANLDIVTHTNRLLENISIPMPLGYNDKNRRLNNQSDNYNTADTSQSINYSNAKISQRIDYHNNEDIHNNHYHNIENHISNNQPLDTEANKGTYNHFDNEDSHKVDTLIYPPPYNPVNETILYIQIKQLQLMSLLGLFDKY